MLASILMGLLGGQRAMTPLAAVAVTAALGGLPKQSGALRLLARPLVATGAVAVAAAELAGDKMKSAPDRIVPIGLLTRFAACAVVGASLAPRRQRWLAAALGGTTAVVSSYFGWRARTAAMSRYGQTQTGLVEDAIVVVGAIFIMRNLGRLSAESSRDIAKARITAVL